MSNNIHRISDFENNPGGNNPGGNSPLMGGMNSNQDPRKESFCSFLKSIICPTLTAKSFIFWVSLLDIFIYIITLIYGGIEISTSENPTLLAPTYNTLDTFGMLNPKKLRNDMQIWRWITYAFLHSDFVHIFSNLFSQVIMGSYLESFVGFKKIGLLYILSA